jgi:hypothetical protein
MTVRISIEGNAIDNATLRTTPSGVSVSNVTVIVNEPIKNEDGSYSNGPKTACEVTG